MNSAAVPADDRKRRACRCVCGFKFILFILFNYSLNAQTVHAVERILSNRGQMNANLEVRKFPQLLLLRKTPCSIQSSIWRNFTQTRRLSPGDSVQKLPNLVLEF